MKMLHFFRIVDHILRHDAQTNYVDVDGYLPLHYAALKGNQESLKTVSTFSISCSSFSRKCRAVCVSSSALLLSGI